MAVDSRAKGQRAEYDVRDKLRLATKLQWERVPGSGGFGASHGLKGDVYLPATTGHLSKYAIEVKHYKDDVLNSPLFNETVSTLEKFWEQTTREAREMNAKAVLIFKKDRGKWLLAVSPADAEGTAAYDKCSSQMSFFKEKTETSMNICLFDEWLTHMKLEDLIK